MVRDPRVVFDQLFGVGATPGERRERRAEDRSLLDWLSGSVARLQKELGHRGSRASERLPRQRPRDRAPDPESRGVQQQRRAARAARRADRRARFVLRARQADVRPAGAGVRVGSDARVRVQAGTRRLEPHVSGERIQGRVPLLVAPRRARGSHRGLLEDQHLPRQHDSVFPREAEEHAGRRRQPAREHAGDVRLADGRFEPAQPQARAAVPRRTRRRRAQGRACTCGPPMARRSPT